MGQCVDVADFFTHSLDEDPELFDVLVPDSPPDNPELRRPGRSCLGDEQGKELLDGPRICGPSGRTLEPPDIWHERPSLRALLAENAVFADHLTQSGIRDRDVAIRAVAVAAGTVTASAPASSVCATPAVLVATGRAVVSVTKFLEAKPPSAVGAAYPAPASARPMASLVVRAAFRAAPFRGSRARFPNPRADRPSDTPPLVSEAPPRNMLRRPIPRRAAPRGQSPF